MEVIFDFYLLAPDHLGQVQDDNDGKKFLIDTERHLFELNDFGVLKAGTDGLV